MPRRPLISFAGLWRPVDGGGAEFAFSTIDPNPLVALFHPNAMPVLRDEEERIDG